MSEVVISPEDRLRVIEDVSITVLLDASSSMHHVADETRQSANDYIGELQSGASVTLSIAAFADKITWLVDNTPSDTVGPLTTTHYRARGDTAFHDAIGEAIERIEAMEIPPVHPVVVVFTDGEDTASVKYDAEQIKAMIALRRMCGWRFIAFVVGHRAAQATQAAGFLKVDTAPYSGDGPGVQRAFKQLAASTKRLITAVERKALPPATFLV